MVPFSFSTCLNYDKILPLRKDDKMQKFNQEKFVTYIGYLSLLFGLFFNALIFGIVATLCGVYLKKTKPKLTYLFMIAGLFLIALSIVNQVLNH